MGLKLKTNVRSHHWGHYIPGLTCCLQIQDTAMLMPFWLTVLEINDQCRLDLLHIVFNLVHFTVSKLFHFVIKESQYYKTIKSSHYLIYMHCIHFFTFSSCHCIWLEAGKRNKPTWHFNDLPENEISTVASN